MKSKIIALLISMLTAFPALADTLAKDPLDSVQWDDMYDAFLKGRPAQFDNRVKVIAPNYAEDPMNVPVTVDASELGDVTKIVIFADFNPIPLIARFYPQRAKPSVSFRFKIQQSSPVRAAVLTNDGVWHVGGVWVNSAGGGCTVASTGRLTGEWSDYLGEVYGKRWSNSDSNRVRFLIHHPMDTGLVAGIPAFYIEKLEFKNTDGEELAVIELFEPVNENPVLSFDFKGENLSANILMSGTDNNGNKLKAEFVQ
ncbi:MAG: sulfur-oxidizing protein SoxY [Cycloclasticus sp.]|jgi:sulfur-oxidizing protein SoxY